VAAPQYRRVYDQPFDSDIRYMVAGFEREQQRSYFAKGAPEVILKMCRSYLTAAGHEKEMNFLFYDAVRTRIDAIPQAGNIVIAVAYSPGVSGDGANDTIALRAVDGGISLVEHSSPIVRRVSQVLINDLADLLTTQITVSTFSVLMGGLAWSTVAAARYSKATVHRVLAEMRGISLSVA